MNITGITAEKVDSNRRRWLRGAEAQFTRNRTLPRLFYRRRLVTIDGIVCRRLLRTSKGYISRNGEESLINDG